MNGLDIYAKVQKKEAEIESLFDPTSFVLNPRIIELECEIKELQEQCEHEFLHGECKFCKIKEEE